MKTREQRLAEVCHIPIENETIWTNLAHPEVRRVGEHEGFTVVYDTIGDGWIFTNDKKFRSHLAHSAERVKRLVEYIETGKW